MTGRRGPGRVGAAAAEDVRAQDGPRPGIGARLLMGTVRGYQLIVSPWIAPRCRYYPSCSQYAIDALRVQGVVRGTGMSVWRVLRCNPWSRGGVDHVPPRRRRHGLAQEHPDDDPPGRRAEHLHDVDDRADGHGAAHVGTHRDDDGPGARADGEPSPASRPAAGGRTLDSRTSSAQAHG